MKPIFHAFQINRNTRRVDSNWLQYLPSHLFHLLTVSATVVRLLLYNRPFTALPNAITREWSSRSTLVKVRARESVNKDIDQDGRQIGVSRSATITAVRYGDCKSLQVLARDSPIGRDRSAFKPSAIASIRFRYVRGRQALRQS